MIKLIAIDLDGTLLKDDKTISEKNIKTLQAAKQQGVKVVLCTGRPLNSVLPHLETLGLVEEGDFAVTFNGGLIQRNDTGEILSKVLLTKADIENIYQLSQELVFPLDVVSGPKVLKIQPQPTSNPSWYHKLNPLLNFVDVELSELPNDTEFNKAVCAISEEKIDELLPKVPAEYHEQYSIVRSGKAIFEFMPKGVSKADGLRRLGDLLGIQPEEMMALGDEENDQAMIRFVGLGVVMENGTAELKKDAQYITATNEEDGVALAVEKFVLADKEA
ncbi:HAD family phosphatase [Vagococcus coleopterorum]|uniref:HAD family phosphatase n=1 Tax=Vagococcus coleopterorum TaxID=2714946 RepID=A0A6G8AME2_9ENTE|nr:Cof-type HAD-IIB family hydrolase [Vagococcus coleopterorum]QIL46167.1 HAD family phosphatase [Vagococcus coleopterorum]